jgi:hypothetical protein
VRRRDAIRYRYKTRRTAADHHQVHWTPPDRAAPTGPSDHGAIPARDHVGIESSDLIRESGAALHRRFAVEPRAGQRQLGDSHLRKLVGALTFALVAGLGLSVPGVAAASPAARPIVVGSSAAQPMGGGSSVARPMLAAGSAAQPMNPAATGLSTAKVVIIVGPVGVASTQTAYINDANQAYAEAIKFSSNVIRIYSPNATWANVAPALQGASVVVYMGHGNGLTSPYHLTFDINNIPSTVDGLGLNPPGNTTNNSTTTYYGEAELAKSIKLAPNAVVIQGHLCYSAGNSEPQNAPPKFVEARLRADNFTAGWLRTGARAVISEVYANSMAGWYIDELFSTHQTIDQIWRSAPTFNSDIQTSASIRTSWATLEMDPNPNLKTNEHFSRAIGGDLTLTSDAVVGSGGHSTFEPVTLGQSGPTSRTDVGSSWVGAQHMR